MAPGKSKPSQPNQRLKAIVRRLPPDLPPTVFWKTVEPWVQRQSTAEGGQEPQENKENDTVAWSEFKQGIVRKPGKDKDSVYSRAYITFKTPEALIAFHRGYDGWTFKDKTGNMSQAVVEFAPYQRMPSAPSKPDPRQGTIDQDPDFLAFQTALTAPPDPNDTPAEPVIEQDPRSTPLLEHLRAQKAAALATRKAAAAANKKAKAALKEERKVKEGKVPRSKNGKRGGKDKKNGKEGEKSKEGSRSGTPVPPAPGGSKAGSNTASRTASNSGTPRNPKTRDPPGVVYPPGSVGAQQQAAAAAKAQQAQLVRQQLQRQHQQQASRSAGTVGGGGGGGGNTPVQPTPAKAPPMILKRQQPPSTSSSPVSATAPSTIPSMPPSLLTQAQLQGQPQIPKGPKADVAGQKRQVGAAIGAALNDGAGTSQRGGRGRGRGNARGGGPSTRGGRGGRGGRGRGGAVNGGAPS
ncbi:hypothetical protein JCM5350_007651 [Sporobolomyces pararoseus]